MHIVWWPRGSHGKGCQRQLCLRLVTECIVIGHMFLNIETSFGNVFVLPCNLALVRSSGRNSDEHSCNRSLDLRSDRQATILPRSCVTQTLTSFKRQVRAETSFKRQVRAETTCKHHQQLAYTRAQNRGATQTNKQRQ